MGAIIDGVVGWCGLDGEGADAFEFVEPSLVEEVEIDDEDESGGEETASSCEGGEGGSSTGGAPCSSWSIDAGTYADTAYSGEEMTV
jgi:hypothetical protein